MPSITNFHKRILMVLMIILFSAVTGLCGEFEDTLKKAEQGDAGAQYSLGFMYNDGEGVPQDYKFAYAWSSLAAAQGDQNAIKNREIIAKYLTPQQLIEAQDIAAKIQYQIEKQEKQSPKE